MSDAKEAVKTAGTAVREEAKEADAAIDSLANSYSPDEERPLGGYLRAMAAYGALFGSALVVGRLTGKRFPKHVPVGDFALMAVATHKIARIIAKDAVTSPLRAPFTEYKEPAGASELNEDVRGKGWRHAVGELIECPFCLAVWVASTFTAGFTFAPRLTRWTAATFSAVAVSDYLQFAYDKTKQSEQ